MTSEYRKAEIEGSTTKECSAYKKNCTVSVLDLFSWIGSIMWKWGKIYVYWLIICYINLIKCAVFKSWFLFLWVVSCSQLAV